ncbi:ATP-grasp domain-containing protein [Salinimicrobium oceani]|uniref:ATP-grasp domain-containing protein n=1 Tax=Salinimicrobium oceani TaxID=2722702 RepID=A0ABX1CYS8_9FLAO|nr:ATP-grasp domain-containing protein [Salinimicrobium oceani]NJW53419.1 ATP-grasp domain-containing protein [Salinimicrobium oceani]
MNRILVTGAGALLGQGILRSLNHSKKEYFVISADPDVRATGHALADKSYIIPSATENNYLGKIEEIIQKEAIEIILIGTDVELPLFAIKKNYLEDKYKIKVVVSNTEVVEIANNKWLTAEFLRHKGFPFPISALTTDNSGINNLLKNADFPFIAKPVDGARSKGIKIINSRKDLEEVTRYENNLVVQEKLGEDEGEFTTGCLVINGKCVAVVSLVRDLRDGNTWRAYRKGDSPYDLAIAKIAEELGVEGPANFQYRIKNGQPVIFEINCRFSGTTPIRLMFGFNEVEALVEYYLNEKPIKKPNLRQGTVLRTFSDIFVSNEKLDEFRQKGSIEPYCAEFFPFKLKE